MKKKAKKKAKTRKCKPKERIVIQARFGKNLRFVRRMLNIRAVDIAEKTEYHRASVSRIEKGEIEPPMTVAFLMAKMLGVSLERMLTEDLTEIAKKI